MSHEYIAYALLINDIDDLEDITYPRGTLLQTCIDELPRTSDNQLVPVTIRSFRGDPFRTHMVYSPSSHVIIGEKDLQLLLPIKDDKRCQVCQDAEWMDEGRKMEEGDDVIVLKLHDDSKVPGIIKYVGDIYDTGTGALFFGIELSSNHAGKGYNNGFFRSQRFVCNENCGIFRTLAGIRLARNTQSSPSPLINPPSFNLPLAIPLNIEEAVPREPFEDEPGALVSNVAQLRLSDVKEMPAKKEEMSVIKDLSIKLRSHSLEQKKSETSDLFINVGEKVVYLTEESKDEFGIVEWIGMLPGKGNRIYAGVNFKNPIGSGTGKFEDKQYFEAKKKHASFIPLEGLLRATDYGYPSEEVEEQDLMTGVIKRRDHDKTPFMYGERDKSSEMLGYKEGGLHSKDAEELMDKPTLVLHESSLNQLLLNLVHVASFVPDLENPAYSTTYSYVPGRKYLHLYIAKILMKIEKKHESWKEVGNLKKILDRMDECASLPLPLKLFRNIIGINYTKYTIVKSPFKYTKLQDLLKDSEDNGLFCNHFIDNPSLIYIVAFENKESKNLIIPSLTLDFKDIFLSCHSCKEHLKCPECSPKSIGYVCTDCLDKYKSLRLSLFCKNCFDPHHQRLGLNHFYKSGISKDVFEAKGPELCNDLILSPMDKSDKYIKKMKLFAVITSTKNGFRTYVRTSFGEESTWFAKETSGEERDVPDFTSFLENYTTSPSTSTELQEMLDGMDLCFYRPCD